MGLTPMMQQYLTIKERYKDCIVFFRMGDFYEMFFEDAEQVSAAIGITLTSRDGGLEKRVPMCGVPHHTSATYIKKLVDHGFKVAVVEQLTAPQKGKMVERDVVKVVTAGTMSDDNYLTADKNNYVAAVYIPDGEDAKRGSVGSVSWCDITTGHFYATLTDRYDDVLGMINPAEVIKSSDHYGYAFKQSNALNTIIKYFNIMSTNIFDFEETSPITKSVGALLEYLNITQKKALSNISKVQVIKSDEYMVLDKSARENLELTAEYSTKQKRGSLLWVLDKTKTAMGARELVRWINAPLQCITAINQRLDGVSELSGCKKSTKKVVDLDGVLAKIVDIGRISGKIASGDIMPRECQSLATSLTRIGELKELLKSYSSEIIMQCAGILNELTAVVDLVSRAISDTPPALLTDGGYIRSGYNEKLDEYRAAESLGRSWIAKLEAKERVECGIKELKIGFNRIAGYYFEVPLRLTNQVPYRFTRRATTASTERFITEELKEIQEKITGAAQKAVDLEHKLYSEVRATLRGYLEDILTNAEAIAVIDVLRSLSTVATLGGWVRPIITEVGEIDLKKARHPVIEKLIGENKFIANDCKIGGSNNSTIIITGPNMAGKSTYMRMVAINVLLVHIGSFVPCHSATVPITDRIFTRIGASDSMLTGQSTFMVEMNEVSNIVHNATEKSLLLLDEVGRGTGTQEGRALASSIITYVTNKIGCPTLFATHFHDLTALSGDNKKIGTCKAMTAHIDGEIIFLHKIEPGIEQSSFGIDVAKMAGLPKEILDNARKIYNTDKNMVATTQGLQTANDLQTKNSLQTDNGLHAKISGIDVNRLSPMEALVMLGELVKEAKG